MEKSRADSRWDHPSSFVRREREGTLKNLRQLSLSFAVDTLPALRHTVSQDGIELIWEITSIAPEQEEPTDDKIILFRRLACDDMPEATYVLAPGASSLHFESVVRGRTISREINDYEVLDTFYTDMLQGKSISLINTDGLQITNDKAELL